MKTKDKNEQIRSGGGGRARNGGPFDRARLVSQPAAAMQQSVDEVAKVSAEPGALAIPLEMRREALQVLRDGLKAVTRDKNPDNKTRLESARMILAYDVGLPVVRQVRIVGNFATFSDKISKLAESPEGLRTLTQLKEMGVIDLDVHDSFINGGGSDTEEN